MYAKTSQKKGNKNSYPRIHAKLPPAPDGALFLFLPLALLAEHEGKEFVLLFGGHAVQQAGKFLPHGIGRRRIFAQQVADGAAQILGQHLYLCHRGGLAPFQVIYKARPYTAFTASYCGPDTFCGAVLLDILHKNVSVHSDLILYGIVQRDNNLSIANFTIDNTRLRIYDKATPAERLRGARLTPGEYPLPLESLCAGERVRMWLLT
nr:MAG TPA: hypothetical protein [Caudoviricetes sp.]